MLRHLLAALMLGTVTLLPVSRVLAAEPETTAPAAAEAPFTDKQRAALDAAIKSYIMDNPQVLISSVEAYYKTQTDTKQAQEGNLTQFPAGLLDYPGTPVAGNKDSKISVIEFFDYNCGYCKQVASDFKRIIADEPNVRYVFKELPILSETSEVAARYALAANAQGKYLAYHDALMSHQGSISEEFLTAAAKDVGLDVEKLKKDANTQEVRDQLAKNVDLARELGVRGTPFFVVGKQKVPGAIGYTKMKEAIAQERGDVPVPAAATTSNAAPTAAPSAAAATASESSGVDETGVQAEMKQARDEANAMIDQLKAQADEIKKQAAEMQKQADEQIALGKKQQAEKEKADKEAKEAAAKEKSGATKK